MNNLDSSTDTMGQFESQLCWALDRVAMWGESADPHARYKSKIQAKTALQELTNSIGTDTKIDPQ